MGLGTPPPLEDIAVALRDRSWLDLRALDVGTVQRVCPVNITVWPDRDEVLFRQEFWHGEELAGRDLVLDAEDIMWCRPTILCVDDVIPPILPDAPGELSVEWYAREIVAVVTFAEGISEERLRGSNDAYARKLCIRLLWELTPLNQTKIPQFFGYNSGGMTNAALYYTANEKGVADRIRELHALMEVRVGHRLPPFKRRDPRSRQTQLLVG